ncbi:MAG TPA: P2 family phage major capsid protein, partial [bacterium]
HWAKLGPDVFASKIREMIALAIANDLLWVGFHGETDDAAPDQADLSDFAIGWLQLLRAYSGGANFMDEVVATSGIITVGEAKVLHFDAAAAVTSDAGAKAKLKISNHGLPVGMRIFIAGTTNYNGTYLVEDAGDADFIKIAKAYNAENLTAVMTATLVPDYASLDALAADLRNAIPQELRTGLEVVMSDDLRASEEEAVYGAFGRTPTEKAAIIAALSNVAGLTPNYVTPMPAGTMLVTPPNNLAIYMHQNITRKVEDKTELNGFVFYNTFGGVDYIITDYRRTMGAENIFIIK